MKVPLLMRRPSAYVMDAVLASGFVILGLMGANWFHYMRTGQTDTSVEGVLISIVILAVLSLLYATRDPHKVLIDDDVLWLASLLRRNRPVSMSEISQVSYWGSEGGEALLVLKMRKGEVVELTSYAFGDLAPARDVLFGQPVHTRILEKPKKQLSKRVQAVLVWMCVAAVFFLLRMLYG